MVKKLLAGDGHGAGVDVRLDDELDRYGVIALLAELTRALLAIQPSPE